MKRCWIGFAMMLVLFAGGLGVTWGMSQAHEPISRDLEQAAAAALAEDWEQAQVLTNRAKAEWEKQWHPELDDIETALEHFVSHLSPLIKK